MSSGTSAQHTKRVASLLLLIVYHIKYLKSNYSLVKIG